MHKNPFMFASNFPKNTTMEASTSTLSRDIGNNPVAFSISVSKENFGKMDQETSKVEEK